MVRQIEDLSAELQGASLSQRERFADSTATSGLTASVMLRRNMT
jgi:hypothetical protein